MAVEEIENMVEILENSNPSYSNSIKLCPETNWQTSNASVIAKPDKATEITTIGFLVNAENKEIIPLANKTINASIFYFTLEFEINSMV